MSKRSVFVSSLFGAIIWTSAPLVYASVTCTNGTCNVDGGGTEVCEGANPVCTCANSACTCSAVCSNQSTVNNGQCAAGTVAQCACDVGARGTCVAPPPPPVPAAPPWALVALVTAFAGAGAWTVRRTRKQEA